MRIGGVIQSRMSSTRMPGKVLYPILGQPLIAYLLDSLEQCDHLETIVVATSNDAADDEIDRFCCERGIACHRGSLLNVAERFRGLLSHYQWDAFLRVNADSPLLDHRLVDRACELIAAEHCDFVTNAFPRSFPIGQGIEVMRVETFVRGFKRMSSVEELEHIMRFFYRHAKEYRIINFAANDDYQHVQLAVDTLIDVGVVERILAQMERRHWEYPLEEILKFFYSQARTQSAAA